MLVAAIHFRPVHRAPDENAARLLTLIPWALEQGARLVVAPELCLSGFAFATPAEMRPYAQPADGAFGRALARLSLQYSSTIVAGIAEADAGGQLHNTALVATERGEVITVRAPRYPHNYGWVTGFGPGGASPGLPTALGPLRVVLCAGLLLAPPTLTRGGLLAVPASWNDDPPGSCLARWQDLAKHQGGALIVANRYGREEYHTGTAADFSAAVSCIIGSDGEVAARSTGDQRDQIIMTVYAPSPSPYEEGGTGGVGR